MTEVQRRWKKGIWNLVLVMDILDICDFKCKILQRYLYLYVSYEQPKCVYIFWDTVYCSVLNRLLLLNADSCRLLLIPEPRTVRQQVNACY
jgi:hypothetical protein